MLVSFPKSTLLCSLSKQIKFHSMIQITQSCSDTVLVKIRHVSRVADVNEGALELLYEKKLRKKLENHERDENTLEVDPIDALPLKTADGKLYYRTGFSCLYISSILFMMIIFQSVVVVVVTWCKLIFHSGEGAKSGRRVKR